MGHIHIHYSRLDSRSEGAILLVREIARMDDRNQLIDISRKLDNRV
jgi:hypothetical protein